MSEIPNNPPKDAVGRFLEILNGQTNTDYHLKRFEALFKSPRIQESPFHLYLHYEELVTKLQQRLSQALAVPPTKVECNEQHRFGWGDGPKPGSMGIWE